MVEVEEWRRGEFIGKARRCASGKWENKREERCLRLLMIAYVLGH